jgi:dihydroxy-acid dehydratase
LIEGFMTETRKLRSRAWFDNPDNIDMTSLYLERYLNFGISLEELRSGRPIIGIAQTGSDLSPCNRHHLVLAERIREGIREMGGIALEFPVHPIQETGKRPTAGLDRNLAYLGLVEAIYGYPLDGVVLTTGCDKTTPALLMAAATVNIPRLRSRSGRCSMAGTRASARAAAPSCGRAARCWPPVKSTMKGSSSWWPPRPPTGYCNTMGTATTMNSLPRLWA